VKLLLNMNVVPQLGARLGAMGHAWRHVREIGLERAEDPAIVDAARTGDEVIVTHTDPNALVRRIAECWNDEDAAVRTRLLPIVRGS
jgi:predicted nuclease of predicted toxin-antitoxin system